MIRLISSIEKKKKRLTLEDLPPYGPIVRKIHLFDNEIDCLQPNGFAIVQQTINAYARFVNSFCFFHEKKNPPGFVSD